MNAKRRFFTSSPSSGICSGRWTVLGLAIRSYGWMRIETRLGRRITHVGRHWESSDWGILDSMPKMKTLEMGNLLTVILNSTIARKAFGCFRMKIIYHDLYRKSTDQEQAVAAEFCETMDKVLARADCVVLATPFGGSTLITKERFAEFKKGSRLVNIARGSLVDEDALVQSLKSGHLVAAGLDVHAREPEVNKELVKMRNVTYALISILLMYKMTNNLLFSHRMTAHTAGGAIDTEIGFERLSMENIQRVLTGQEPLTPVNKHFFKE